MAAVSLQLTTLRASRKKVCGFGRGSWVSMAAVSLQLTTLRAVANNALDYRPVQVSSRGTATCASVGPSCSVSSSRWSRWGYGRSSRRRPVARAVMEEAVVAEEAETEAPLESLSMYFKAEGSLNDAGIPKLTKILEGTEGVSNVKVYIAESAATVELTKQTSIQATGVASSLVELIEQAGFKMQALSLGFDEDDEEDDEDIEYDPSTYVEDEDEAGAL